MHLHADPANCWILCFLCSLLSLGRARILCVLDQYALAALGNTLYQNNKPMPLNYLLQLT